MLIAVMLVIIKSFFVYTIFLCSRYVSIHNILSTTGLVVPKVDSAIHWINHFPLDNLIGWSSNIHWITLSNLWATRTCFEGQADSWVGKVWEQLRKRLKQGWRQPTIHILITVMWIPQTVLSQEWYSRSKSRSPMAWTYSISYTPGS